MRLASWLRANPPGTPRHGRRPAVEVREDRVVPSAPGDLLRARQFGTTALDSARTVPHSVIDRSAVSRFLSR
jgi:hypothetical protein